jgi:ribonuclease P protein component
VVHAASSTGPSSRVGFVVSKAVGGAVVRNRVKRRLRHLVAAELDGTRTGVDVVVRALPAAASSPLRVEGDLSSAWRQARNRLSPDRSPVSP